MNIRVVASSIEKSTLSLISRIFSDVSPDAGFNCESIQQTPVLLHGYVTSFVWGVRPLKATVAQTERKQAEADPLKEQPFDPVLLYTAEEEQRSLFQGIQAICQTNHGSQAVNSSPEIRSSASQDYAPDPSGLPKHAESPRESWTRFSHWSLFRRRPGTAPAESWLLPKKESQDCPLVRKVMQPAVSVHRR